jgi:peptidoglycan hydrolase-like protein with peptidoglycan-binding domain
MPAVLLLVAAIAAVSAGVYSFLRSAVPPQESHKVETGPTATVSPPPAALPGPSVPTVAPAPVDTAPVSSTDFVPPKPIGVSPPLDAHGISELQTRLGHLGFSPGPVDGVAGPMTIAAIRRYQQSRGRPVTTTVDDDLLDQVRKEQTP